MKKVDYEDKAIRGTERLDKLRDAHLTTVTKPPPPQPYLTTAGKRIYKAICQHLIDNQLLCEVDSYYASSIAHNLDLYNRMAKQIEDKEKKRAGSGYFQEFANGVVQASPYFTTMNKCFDIFEKGCRNLGMTAKGRDSILGFSKKSTEDDDPYDEFGLNKMKGTPRSDGRPSAANGD